MNTPDNSKPDWIARGIAIFGIILVIINTLFDHQEKISRSPVITEHPSEVRGNDSVIIKGKRFGRKQGKVRIDTHTVEDKDVKKWNDGNIEFIMPPKDIGAYNIVVYKSSNGKSSKPVQIKVK